eukprot:CAMPEP_0172492310 /NCGR_PEP_ID=MMETSP1066-20121228/23412_1 /TAXON_ID=671091 /ORGANISM="Coscinodiscus wailesii, Strain CCMP2513" /LENGTH=239 /DNA_ID=CAMNT_0013261845 /DNA_START=149 /DNA_END=864 /DNA_ORIENTATION=+
MSSKIHRLSTFFSSSRRRRNDRRRLQQRQQSQQSQQPPPQQRQRRHDTQRQLQQHIFTKSFLDRYTKISSYGWTPSAYPDPRNDPTSCRIAPFVVTSNNSNNNNATTDASSSSSVLPQGSPLPPSSSKTTTNDPRSDTTGPLLLCDPDGLLDDAGMPAVVNAMENFRVGLYSHALPCDNTRGEGGVSGKARRLRRIVNVEASGSSSSEGVDDVPPEPESWEFHVEDDTVIDNLAEEKDG